MADERLCNPISTPELERRWAAVRAAMPEQRLDALMNIGLHPTFGNARLFVTVCDNFLIGPDGKIENIHHTPRKIFEL